MNDRPILFSSPMVRSILDGTKTQTRRLVKLPRWAEECNEDHDFELDGEPAWPHAIARKTGCLAALDCPYGQPGDLLWVREAWRAPNSLDDLAPNGIGEACLNAGYREPWCPIQYEADGARTSEKDWREFGPHPSTQTPGRYRHARFMPRWASRITLEVTGVRVERLQDISEADALAEGCRWVGTDKGRDFYSAHSNPPGVKVDVFSPMGAPTAKDAYMHLWERINGAGSWAANQWVWVIEFRRAP